MTFLLGKYISTANKNVSEHRRVSEEDIWKKTSEWLSSADICLKQWDIGSVVSSWLLNFY